MSATEEIEKYRAWVRSSNPAPPVLSDGHTTLDEARATADEMHELAEMRAEECDDSAAALLSKGAAIMEMMLAAFEQPTEERLRAQREFQEAIVFDRLAQVLREHWLTGTECNKVDATNAATCYCSVWRSGIERSPVAAVERWIEHVEEHLRSALRRGGEHGQ